MTDDQRVATYIHGPVYGLVQGHHNTVTLVFEGGARRTVPFLAPPPPPYPLIGRDGLLCELRRQLVAGCDTALNALQGLPGVGKTALAIAIANDRKVLGHFQDGVLWAGLGVTPNLLAVITAWGAALGISARDVAKPDALEDWVWAVHAAIGMSRLLIVIDDAWDPIAALSLRVGGPNCAHLVTTRIPEVAIRFAGDNLLPVTELGEADGLALLARLAPAAVEEEPDAARVLVRHAGGLPLALTLIGNHLRTRTYSGSGRRLRAALRELRHAEQRLRLAEPQAPLERHPSLAPHVPISLMSSIQVSYQALSPDAGAALGDLALFPAKPNTFPEGAALAVTGRPAEILDELVDAGIVEADRAGRYALHQAVNDFARALPPTQAAGRFIAHHIAFAEANAREVERLEREFTNLLAAFDLAYEHSEHEALVRGVDAVYDFLEQRGLYAIAEEQLERCLDAAEAIRGDQGRAAMLTRLGEIVEQRGDLERAEQVLREALDRARRARHDASVVEAVLRLGWVSGARGQLEAAVQHFEQALELAGRLVEPGLRSRVLQGLGWAYGVKGDLARAIAHLEEALSVARTLNDPKLVATITPVLGWRLCMAGSYTAAGEHFRECLELAEQLGRRDRMIDALNGLGWLLAMRGAYDEAEPYFLRALTIAREIGHRAMITLLLNLGWITRERGQLDRAVGFLEEGLTLARRFGQAERISDLLAVLGDLLVSRGDLEAAQAHFSEALEHARRSGYDRPITDALGRLAMIARRQARYIDAEAQLAEALTRAGASGNPSILAALLLESGELGLARGEPSAASADFQAALDYARVVESTDLTGLALYGIGRTIHAASGNAAAAARRGHESLQLLEASGNAHAQEVRDWLEALQPPGAVETAPSPTPPPSR